MWSSLKAVAGTSQLMLSIVKYDFAGVSLNTFMHGYLDLLIRFDAF